MKAPKHPAELNALLQYRQAGTFFNRTSRAKNPAWYQGALDLDFQLHIRTDGAGVAVFLYDRREDLWAHGPALAESQLLDPEAMTAYVSEAVKHALSAGGKALGVVLYMADEFSLTEINPHLVDRDAIGQISEALVTDPASVLADSVSPDQSSWRLLPYFSPASPSIATAVTISRRHQPVLAALSALGEAEDFPIITLALSAPLIALLGIPGTVKASPGRPSTVILQYPFFTDLAFFDGNSDLLLVRTQLHRGLRRPPNFHHAISTTIASLELADPDIFVFPLGENIDRTLTGDLKQIFGNSHLEEVALANAGTLPPWCAECLISTRIPEPDEPLPGITFQALREGGWAFQNFLPPAPEVAEVYPTKAEMKLYRLLRIGRFAALLIALLVISWLVKGLFTIVRTPEWAFDPADTTSVKMRMAKLNLERQTTEHWDSLLADRSKGWIVMESLSRLFPEDSSVLVKNFDYSSRSDTVPGQPKAGFVKEWKISGLVKREATELLAALNSREGISAHFNEIAMVTGNSAYRTDIGTRSLLVSVRTQENTSFKAARSSPDDIRAGGPDKQEGTYPFTFELGITQRFEATDPMAITVAKAP